MGIMANSLGRAFENQERTRNEFFADRQVRDTAGIERDRLREELKEEEQRKKERQEREEREERMARIEKQERAEQMNTTLQTIQLSVMRDLVTRPAEPAGGAATSGAGTSGVIDQSVQSELKTLLVYYLNDEDSEQYPTEVQVMNISDLKEQLAEVCGIKNKDSKDFKIILDSKEVIINVGKLEDGGEYSVSKKIKTSLVKLYMNKR